MSFHRYLGAGMLSLAMVSSAPAQVQTPQPPTAPPVAATIDQANVIGEGNPLANRAQVPAVLRFLQSQGVKLTTLGTEGGLAAYLGESPNGRMQVFYVAPDGGHVVAGLMFDSQGANITGVQLGEMQRRFDTAQKQGVAGAASPAQAAGASPIAAADPAPASSPTTSAPAIPPAPALPAAAPKDSPALSPLASPSAQAPALAPPAAPALPTAAPAAPAAKPQASAAPAAAPFVTPASASEKYVSGLDGGAVGRMLEQTPWFQVGVKEAPAIYMVVDPQCPFCHAAWRMLQRYVYDKKVQLRIVMIAGLKGSPPLAVSILSRDNPGEAWLSGEGSVDNFTIQPPPAADSRKYQDAQRYLDLNAQFVRTFGISSTPTFLYFGKDQRLYSTVGLPQDVDGFMAALF